MKLPGFFFASLLKPTITLLCTTQTNLTCCKEEIKPRHGKFQKFSGAINFSICYYFSCFFFFFCDKAMFVGFFFLFEKMNKKTELVTNTNTHKQTNTVVCGIPMLTNSTELHLFFIFEEL